jgi:hypothetical protein
VERDGASRELPGDLVKVGRVGFAGCRATSAGRWRCGCRPVGCCCTARCARNGQDKNDKGYVIKTHMSTLSPALRPPKIWPGIL